MKKIIMILIYVFGIELYSVNASVNGYILTALNPGIRLEVNEEFDPNDYVFGFEYLCLTDPTNKMYIEGEPLYSVDTTVLGSFQLEVYVKYYNVCIGDTVIESMPFTVDIYDTTAPIIYGIKNYVVDYGSKLPDFSSGITYSDNYSENDDITLEIDASGVNENELGEYKVYYIATDHNGNKSVDYSEVSIVDSSAPNLSTPKSITINVFDYTFDFKGQATAIDAYEGDVSNRISVDIKDLNFNVLGEYEIEYSVHDMHGNTVTNTVVVFVEDSEKPKINKVDDITIEVGTNIDEIDFLSYISITDNYCTDLEVNYDIYSLNTDVVGEYSIVYYASDGFNDIYTVVKVSVVDTTIPEIEMIDGNIQINIGDSEYDLSNHFSVSDNYDTNLTANIDTSFVNFNEAGFYPVTITVIDTYGNTAYLTANIEIIVIESLGNNDDEGVILNDLDSSASDDVSNELSNENDYKSAGFINKITAPIIIIFIPIAAFVVAKTYLLRGL